MLSTLTLHWDYGWFVVTIAAAVYALWQILFGPRVLSLLVFRYLRKRRIAWVSLVAVTLCTMMVLVVISVMGGWLQKFRDTNHSLVGDIVIFRNPLIGFAHYDEMIAELKAQVPEVKAAAPMIQTYGHQRVRR
jgi:ABC-type lipoprotein release transport system permease subunit